MVLEADGKQKNQKNHQKNTKNQEIKKKNKKSTEIQKTLPTTGELLVNMS